MVSNHPPYVIACKPFNRLAIQPFIGGSLFVPLSVLTAIQLFPKLVRNVRGIPIDACHDVTLAGHADFDNAVWLMGNFHALGGISVRHIPERTFSEMMFSHRERLYVFFQLSQYWISPLVRATIMP